MAISRPNTQISFVMKLSCSNEMNKRSTINDSHFVWIAQPVTYAITHQRLDSILVQYFLCFYAYPQPVGIIPATN